MGDIMKKKVVNIDEFVGLESKTDEKNVYADLGKEKSCAESIRRYIERQYKREERERKMKDLKKNFDERER